MTAIEQIEQLIEKLPSEEFQKLTAWLDQRRHSRSSKLPDQDTPGSSGKLSPLILRDHSAFLNSYAPEDEGLYDDAAAR